MYTMIDITPRVTIAASESREKLDLSSVCFAFGELGFLLGAEVSLAFPWLFLLFFSKCFGCFSMF